MQKKQNVVNPSINGEKVGNGDSKESLLKEKNEQGEIDQPDDESWLKRLFRNQEHSLLYFMIGTYGADGMMMVQMVAMNLIYKNEYKVSPTELALYHGYMIFPVLLRIFIGVFVDSQLVTRKALSIFVNIVTFVCNMGIAFRIFDSPGSLCLALVVVNFAHQFLEAVCSTYVIQQARGVYKGQEDIQSYKFMIMGVSGTSGAILGMILVNYGALRLIFGMRGLIYGFAGLQAIFLSPALENNERAAIKSQEIIQFEKQYREKLIAQGKIDKNDESYIKPPFCGLLCMKLKLAKQGFMEPVFRNFVFFLIFLSITNPSFMTYDFYFHIDQQQIPLVMFNVQQLMGILTIIGPILYQKYFQYKDYYVMFYTYQALFILSDSMNLLAATRFNLYLGIPDTLLYFFGGQLAPIIEMSIGGFAIMLIYSKIIPPGCESTLQSLSMTVMFFSFTMKAFLGILINETLFHVTSADMSNYASMRTMSLICSTIPLIYLKCAVPSKAKVNALQDKFVQQSNVAKNKNEGLYKNGEKDNEHDSLEGGKQMQSNGNDDYKKTNGIDL